LEHAGVHNQTELAPVTLPMTGEDQQRILGEWNGQDADYPRSRRIEEWFRRRVRLQPNAIAVDDGQRLLTYAQLDDHSDRLASALVHSGVSRSDRVAVFLARSVDLATATMAVLKAGAVYVPIDPRSPNRRSIEVLQTSDARAVISDHRTIVNLRLDEATHQPAQVDTILLLDEALGDNVLPRDLQDRTLLGPAQWMGHEPIPAAAPGTAEDLAYIIFTSGSTGRPKGVAVRHRPVSNLIHWVNERFSIGPQDKILFVTSLSFDLSVYDLFGVLAAGGTVRVADDAEVSDPRTLLRILDTEEITFWDSAPAFLQQVVGLPEFQSRPEKPPSLRLTFLSGDWIPLALPGQIKGRFTGATFVALGGATEATVWSNYFQVDDVDPSWSSIPYGRPIPNARYYILDDYRALCPVGSAGELWIGGACLADGYVNDPRRTAERFVDDPFAPAPGSKIYRTGDRARWQPDGTIELLGRLDHQVKIRGHRVELGEIESALRDESGVKNAAVISTGDRLHGLQLVAFVAPSGEVPPTAEALRVSLRNRLPGYMVPRRFVFLAALPLTNSGKADRNALAETTSVESQTETAYRGPRDELERRIADAFQKATEVKRVGLDDAFLMLGGDSLSALGVVLDLERSGVVVGMHDILETDSVEALAQRVRETSRDERPAPTTSLPTDAAPPLSPSQCWLFERELIDPERYNDAFLLSLTAPVGGAGIQEALQRIVDRHPVLASRFAQGASGWKRADSPARCAVDYGVVSLAGRSESEQARVLEDLVGRLRRSQDLRNGPLLIVRLVERGGGHHPQLVFVVQHLVFDGLSLAILVNELSASIQGEGSETVASLPPLSESYASWSRAWRDFAESPAAIDAIRPWLTPIYTGGAPLPTDHALGANQYAFSEDVSAQLTKEITDAWVRSAHAARVGLDVWLLAAWGRAVGDWSGNPVFTVDYTGHGRAFPRQEADASRLIGYFSSVTPIAINLQGQTRPSEALRSVEGALEPARQRGNLFNAVKFYGPDVAEVRRLRAVPRPQVKFNFHGRNSTCGTGFMRVEPRSFPGVLAGENLRAYLFNIEAQIEADRLVVRLKYSRNHHRRATAQHLLDTTLKQLNTLVRDLDH